MNMEWYCIHTKPQKELSLASYLGDVLGLEVYYPRFRTKKVTRRVKRMVVQPLFPRYLFCRFNLAEHFRSVQFARNSLGPVHCGNSPVAVCSATIERMKEEFGEVLSESPTDTGFCSGDCIRILDGPMQGVTGTVLKNLGAGERVEVLLDFLNCDTRVNIATSRVDLAEF
ncbi:transcription termination/antitermination protein NusG [Pelagicoccus mobilis]|uniref:NusG-like N-terminal domain-containing protein n=1 Tax=Pelagicoccus mobilis TaxID=415221 RepID=A0A934RX40_9BACT|nr:transcription termination/antitermination NusG family protein [Pelagicoccus mobilis]MBK1877933.1 hypothetical protein [Pelagicoccus mobilis]